ncbi:hypothetical protein M0R45_011758 [Rubus argutus]|uniref:Uncharacterized protein n=1 Tax=Rubus argutus TaxID=59490 RepID=A0AAW1YCK7_RUBAR
MAQNTTIFPINVGVVLDLDAPFGKMGLTCINMAISDFYASHAHYNTRLVLHTRNSTGDVVAAAAAESPERPEGGALGRVKKPQEALEAREWRWVCDGLTKRANPSPYKTKARLGLSAIYLSLILDYKCDQQKQKSKILGFHRTLSTSYRR